jgi:hypothetical protein
MDAQKRAETSEWRSLTTMIDTALIGVGIVMVQPYLTSPAITLIESISVIAFAGAIPLLSALLLLGLHENHYQQQTVNSLTVSLARMIARLSALVGLGAGLWQISGAAGVVFTLSSLLGIVVYSTGYWWLDRQREIHDGDS